MAETDKGGTTRLGVLVSFAVDCAETLGLGAAAWVSGSVALRAQTAASAADVAVQVFLLIGVLRSVRPPDETHPLGYGRERFYWSLFAALGIFVGGGGLGLDESNPLPRCIPSARWHADRDRLPGAGHDRRRWTLFALEIALRPRARGRRPDAVSRCEHYAAPEHRSRIDHERGRRRLRRLRWRHRHSRAGPERGDDGARHLTRWRARSSACCFLAPRRSCCARTGSFCPGAASRLRWCARCAPGHRRAGGTWSTSRTCSPS